MRLNNFKYEHPRWVSDTFSGGVKLQIEALKDRPAFLGIETRLSPDNDFVCMKRVMVSNAHPVIVTIDKYAEGQEFRVALPYIDYLIEVSQIASMATSAAVQAVSDRVKDLEEGNEPLVLSVDTNTGNLIQSAVSSGKFGVDYDSGYLTFTPN